MKKAFTLLELVFVVVVIGILAAAIIPRYESTNLNEAATQLVSHIRYTQHLAMIDDKYSDTDDPANNWWKGRWILKFKKSILETNNEESYTIFSDHYGTTFSGNANSEDEIAANPLDMSKKLTGGDSAIHYDDEKATKNMNLGMKYGITSVSLGSNCVKNGSKGIAFDHLGRPLKGGISTMNSPYQSQDYLISADCNITLSDGSESIIVKITPETGYTCILDENGDCLNI